MCGITGLVKRDPKEPVDPLVLERMTAALVHRGPDDAGLHLEPGVGLGFRRLSIIDAESGRQPLSNEDGSCRVICNGEIYNHLELREALERRGHRFRTRTDAEVVVHLYEDHGPECLRHLRGMFAIAIWDGRRRELILARDRLGIKPLYYCLTAQSTLLFGSEVKALLASGQVSARLDPAAFHDLLTFGFVLPPATSFATVSKLPPAHFLICREGRLTLRQYWDVPFPHRHAEDRNLSAEAWNERLAAKLEEVIRLHLRSDVPVGAWLSGGLDSSAIVALMSRISAGPVQTFSLGFADQPGRDELGRWPLLADLPDCPIPNRKVWFSKEHFSLYPRAMWHMEEPTSSGLPAAQLLLAGAAAETHRVVLTGEGADELFGGYPWYAMDRFHRPLTVLPQPLRRWLANGPGPFIPKWSSLSRQVFAAPRRPLLERFAHLLGPYHREGAMSLASDALRTEADACEGRVQSFREPQGFGNWDPLARLQYLDIKTRMVGLITHSLDRMTMARSLEARVPFLDHELVELSARIPARLKLAHGQDKYILRQAMSGVLPEEIRLRKKHGLGPASGVLFRGAMPAFASDLLSGEMLKNKGYFDVDRVHALLMQHRRKEKDCRRLLTTILGIQLWDEIFVRKRVTGYD